MAPNASDRLDDEIRAYGWERAHGKLEEASREQLRDAVNAWLDGSVIAEDAAASVRDILHSDPAELPLDPRSARIVDGRLFRRSGKRWLASDGTPMPPAKAT